MQAKQITSMGGHPGSSFPEEIGGPAWNAESVFLDMVEIMTVEQYFLMVITKTAVAIRKKKRNLVLHICLAQGEASRDQRDCLDREFIEVGGGGVSEGRLVTQEIN